MDISGKQFLKSAMMLEKLQRLDFGVSRSASGNVSTIKEMMAPIAMAKQAATMFFVMRSKSENATSASTERMV